jgi:hypothetical protein
MFMGRVCIFRPRHAMGIRPNIKPALATSDRLPPPSHPTVLGGCNFLRKLGEVPIEYSSRCLMYQLDKYTGGAVTTPAIQVDNYGEGGATVHKETGMGPGRHMQWCQGERTHTN